MNDEEIKKAIESGEIIDTPIKNGYIEPELKDEDYIFGDASIPDEIEQADGQWDTYEPTTEEQVKSFDTDGCTVFGTSNQVEIYEKRMLANAPNYSDRALYNMAGVKPPGADPQTIYETIRKGGLVNEVDLPWSDDIDTLQKYSQPRPLTPDLIQKAKDWLASRTFLHDYLPKGVDGFIDPEVMKEALKRSPLAVGVYAWASSGDKYIRLGADTHWTIIDGFVDGQYWKNYDSYPPFQKKLAWDFKFKTVKRIYIRKKDPTLTPEKISIFQKILDAMLKILGLFKTQVEKPIVTLDELNPIVPPEIKQMPTIQDLAHEIEIYENIADKTLNNPGALRYSPYQAGQRVQQSTGKMLAYFNTYQDGWNALIHQLTIVCNGTSPAYNSQAKILGLPNCGELTLSQFFGIYAPKFENATSTYATTVANNLKVLGTFKMREFLGLSGIGINGKVVS